MVKLEKAVTARLDYKGERFELLVDPDLALALKKGEKVDPTELLAVDTIFKDAAKGSAQSPEALSKAFGTTELIPIAKRIILEGEVHLTTEQRRVMREEKRRKIIEFIVRNAINPQAKAPHPPKRIENAFEEAKIQVDEMKSVEEQLQTILPQLKRIIPLSMEQLKIAIRIPAESSGKASNALHKYSLLKEEWQGDGSLVAVVQLPGGLKQDFLNEMNHICHSNLETKILD